mmetsp:Transcript_22237/g.59134  ORF Transcript_22237/g.59134 Transcript_22237/m.59134 type:complete len:206 (+) Transcript_22237:519-1136(+)
MGHGSAARAGDSHDGNIQNTSMPTYTTNAPFTAISAVYARSMHPAPSHPFDKASAARSHSTLPTPHALFIIARFPAKVSDPNVSLTAVGQVPNAMPSAAPTSAAPMFNTATTPAPVPATRNAAAAAASAAAETASAARRGTRAAEFRAASERTPPIHRPPRLSSERVTMRRWTEAPVGAPAADARMRSRFWMHITAEPTTAAMST